MRLDWRDIAEQQAEALASATGQNQTIAHLLREIEELSRQVDESAEVMDRWARESRAASERASEAQRQLFHAESLRRGLVP